MYKTITWDPCNYLLENTNSKYGVIILNTPLDFGKIPNLIESLWSKGKRNYVLMFDSICLLQQLQLE